MIRQGEIYWIDLEEAVGSGPGYRHPHVVIQNNMFNWSRIGTVVVCALTSNVRRGEAPGNVLLDEGEGGLPKRSVALASQAFTVDKGQLGDYIGALSGRRVLEIIEGVKLVLEPREVE